MDNITNAGAISTWIPNNTTDPVIISVEKQVSCPIERRTDLEQLKQLLNRYGIRFQVIKPDKEDS